MPRSKRLTHDRLLEHCRALPGTTEDVKWGDDLVFSVGGKMYAAFLLPELESFSFKVDPLTFDALTAQDGIAPAPYLARASWVRVVSREVLPEETALELLEASHALVAAKLTRKLQRELGLA